MKRRTFLQSAATAAMAAPLLASESNTPALGNAEHCVMIWLGGGMAQIDTFDPKPMGDAKAKKAGGYYRSIDTVVPGVQVCEHLSETAKMMDRVTAMRTVHHDVVDEHAAATNRMHTGGAAADGVPAYMVIGYPNITRGPGFLGQKSGYVYLTDIQSGPAGLARPADVNDKRQARRQDLLSTVRDSGRKRFGGDRLYADYDAAVGESLRLSGPDFMKSFDLSGESDSLRNKYGDGFGQRCLLTRRLFQSGVRFIELSHNMNFRNGTGWDTHNDGQLNQHLLIKELDVSLTAMMADLESHNMLSKTLIVISGEFGRPAQFDSGGGRGHHSKNFSVVLAGGGLNHQGAYGVSDNLAMKAVENPVSVPDLYNGDRPVPITDGGQAIEKLLI
jgi:hypothetical protein